MISISELGGRVPITLSVPRHDGDPLELLLDEGGCVFVLGANGTGKSSLMHSFYAAHHEVARRLSAHRQTWFSTSSLSLSPEQKRQTELHMRGTDIGGEARWKDDFSSQRADIAIFDLIAAENVRARTIATAFDADDVDLARELAKKSAPITIINELLRLSNIQVVISVERNEHVMARRPGGDPYSVAELSDGERNALLIAASVLTAAPGTMLLIDEPERHLHRSIISPLLSQLFQHRSDCRFVVSTHDVLLPLDSSGARTLLVRGCTYKDQAVLHWDVDLLPAEVPVDDAIKKDILGSRRKLVFVEGAEQRSLDKSLYSLALPGVSVVAKNGCREVQSAVKGVRGAADLLWMQAFGIIDNDGRTQEDVASLQADGIYALTVCMIESVYYHPKIQQWVAERHATVTGQDRRAASRRQGPLPSMLWVNTYRGCVPGL